MESPGGGAGLAPPVGGGALFGAGPGHPGGPGGGGAGLGGGGGGGVVVAVVDASASAAQRGPGGAAVLDAAKAGAQRLAELAAAERLGPFAAVAAGGRASGDPFPRPPAGPARGSEVVAFQPRGGPAETRESGVGSFAEGLARLRGVRAGGTGGGQGAGLSRALELAAALRLRSGADNFGRGWRPGALEPSLILILADGSDVGAAGPSGRPAPASKRVGKAPEGFRLPPLPASDLFRGGVRWDQRICLLHIHAEADPRAPRGLEPLRGPPLVDLAPASAGPLGALCAETGGRVLQARTMKGVLQGVDACFQSAVPAGAVDFESLPAGATEPDAAAALQALSSPKSYRLFLMKRGGLANGASWPIPEAFWPEGPAELAFRPARPAVSWVEQDVDISQMTLPSGHGFPAESFEVDAPPSFKLAVSEAFQRLDRKHLLQAGGEEAQPSPQRKAGISWLLYVRNSLGDGHLGQPFGYIALSRGGRARVHLLPYNFPALTNLIRALNAMGPGHKLNPPPAWRVQFEAYLGSIPRYYHAQLRMALRKQGMAQHAIPEPGSPGPLAWMPALQAHQARAASELEALQAEIQPAAELPAAPGPGRGRRLCEATAHAKFGVIPLPILEEPLSVPRERLVHQVAMTVASLRSLVAREGTPGRGPRCSSVLDRIAAAGEAADRHSVPVAAMGDYEEAMQQQMASVLRDPLLDEADNAAQNRAFGNPFRRETKKQRQSKRWRGSGSPGSSTSRGSSFRGAERSSREGLGGANNAEQEVSQKRARVAPQASLAALSVAEGFESSSADMGTLLARRGRLGAPDDPVLPDTFERLQEADTQRLFPAFAALAAHRLNFGILRPLAGATLRSDVETLVERARGGPILGVQRGGEGAGATARMDKLKLL